MRTGPPLYFDKISDLRDRVMSMNTTFDCRQELADTLEVLGRLEADFCVLIREVSRALYDQKREVSDTSREFDQMADAHGVDC